MSGMALVTGASSGLGVALARELARRGHDLVLTARSEAPMTTLAAELKEAHGVSVAVEALDLSRTDAAAELVRRLDALSLDPEIVINNAGVGFVGPFVEQDPARLRGMLNLGLVTLTELTHVYGQRMVRRGGGRIMLVGSVAGFGATPHAAIYAASKGYIRSLGEALNVELGPKVSVTVLAPGLMETGFNSTAGFTPPAAAKNLFLPPEEVARTGLDAMFAGRSIVVPGRLNRLIVRIGHILPRGTVTRMNDLKKNIPATDTPSQ